MRNNIYLEVQDQSKFFKTTVFKSHHCHPNEKDQKYNVVRVICRYNTLEDCRLKNSAASLILIREPSNDIS